jgi:hypothetical protein
MQYLEARDYKFELQTLALAAVLWIRLCMFWGLPDQDPLSQWYGSGS